MAAVDNVEHQQQGITIIRKKDRRHYGYESIFGNHAGIFYDLKNVPFVHTLGLVYAEYWSKHRRKYLEHTYPSFFMDIKRIPTYRWECSEFSESDNEWSCT
jgi:hypothetical protein